MWSSVSCRQDNYLFFFRKKLFQDVDFSSVIPSVPLSLCPAWEEMKVWGKEGKKIVFEKHRDGRDKTIKDIQIWNKEETKIIEFLNYYCK